MSLGTVNGMGHVEEPRLQGVSEFWEDRTIFNPHLTDIEKLLNRPLMRKSIFF